MLVVAAALFVRRRYVGVTFSYSIVPDTNTGGGHNNQGSESVDPAAAGTSVIGPGGSQYELAGIQRSSG